MGIAFQRAGGVVCFALLTAACALAHASDNPDLVVTHISRTPRYPAYTVVDQKGAPALRIPGAGNKETFRSPAEAARVKRAPQTGETVRFRAEVLNLGKAPSGPFRVRWTLDGKTVDEQDHAGLAPFSWSEAPQEQPFSRGFSIKRWIADDGSRAVFDWTWSWRGDHHTVGVVIDPDNNVSEICETDNAIEQATDALSFLVVFEKSAYDSLRTRRDPSGGLGAEAWVRRHLRLLQQALDAPAGEALPQGAGEKVRLDGLVVLDRSQSSSRVCAAAADAGFDVAWAFPTGLTTPVDPKKTSFELLRQWGKGLGLLDAEALRLRSWDNRVMHTGGHLSRVGHAAPPDGLMQGLDAARFRLADALVLAAMKGRRRGYSGDYLWALPRSTRVRVLDRSGEKVPSAMVRVFQTRDRVVDREPVLEQKTNRQGYVALPNRTAAPAWSDAGFQRRDNPFGDLTTDGANALLLLEVSARGHVETRWLHAAELARACFLGDRDRHDLDWKTRIPPAKAPDTPSGVSAAVRVTEGRARVAVSWKKVSGARGYRIWRALYPEYRWRHAGTAGAAEAAFEEIVEPEKLSSRVLRYAVSAMGEGGSDSAFSTGAGVALPSEPSGVCVLSDGRPLLLDKGMAWPLESDLQGGILGPFCPDDAVLHPVAAAPTLKGGAVLLVTVDGKGNPKKSGLRETGADGALMRSALFDRGKGEDRLNDPCGIALDRRGNVIVVERGADRLHGFNTAWKSSGVFGETGSGPGKFRSPSGVAIDGSGHLLAVADEGNQRVQLFHYAPEVDGMPAIRFARDIADLSGPCSVAFTADGDLAVVERAGRRVRLFDPASGAEKGVRKGVDGEPFAEPRAIAAGEGGGLWVVDPGRGGLLRLAGAGGQPVEFPVTCRWSLEPNDYAHYRTEVTRTDKGVTTTELEDFRLFGVFGYELAEKTKFHEGLVHVQDLPHALAMTLPSKSVLPDAREQVRLEFPRLCKTAAVSARGELIVMGEATVRGVPVVHLRGAFRLSDKGRDFRTTTTHTLTSGTISYDAYFRPDLGVMQEVALEFEITRRNKTSGKSETIEGKERLSFVRVFPYRYDGFEDDVNRAIERGVRHVKSRQKQDGTFGPYYGYKVGQTAIGLLTLLKSGVPADDARTAKGVAWLLDQPFAKTYGVGLSIMAIEASRTPPAEADLFRQGLIKKFVRKLSPDEKTWMGDAADWLVENMHDEGWWGYPNERGDFSNTQYGVLGLSAASRCDVEVSVSVWEQLCSLSMNAQQKGGESFQIDLEFATSGKYGRSVRGRKYARGWGYTSQSEPYASMNAAGITCVIQGQAGLAKLRSPKAASMSRKLKASRLDGFAWYGASWTIKRNAGRYMSHYYYYLYGLERACVLGGVKHVNGHDWYWEGALQLLLRQQQNGGWRQGKTGHLHLTCFALLFLKRATVPVLTDR